MLTSARFTYLSLRPAIWLVRSLLLTLAVSQGCTSSDPDTESGDGSAVTPDAYQEDGSVEQVDADEDSAQVAPDAEVPPSGPEVDEDQPCDTNSQCDDHIFCNGEERCISRKEGEDPVCQPALRLPCSLAHPCEEALQGCECTNKNLDGDLYDAEECDGQDCDDTRPDCYPGAPEFCDAEDRDEDCEPTTYNSQSTDDRNLDGDADGDGRIDERCRNHDPKTDQWYGGIDCNDHNPSIHREASEVCDYEDNNCNGFVDEKLREDGSSEEIDGGLMVTFYPDRDRDLYGGGDEGDAIRACDFLQPPGYILATEGLDCDDDDRRLNPDAQEVCDGKDNDCDGLIDKNDSDFRKQYFFDDTEVDCRNGNEVIVQCPDQLLWCPELGDTIDKGCRRDGTRLTSCGACQTNCKFACGRQGCDEIVQLSLGDDHTCALTREGKVACWGRGDNGRLGNDSTGRSAVPVSVLDVDDVKAIAAGAGHSCAVVGDTRQLYCWGDNAARQLGSDLVGSSSLRPVPVPGVGTTPALTGVVQIAAGAQHTCAVLSGGELTCFGAIGEGMPGVGEIPGTWTRPAYVRREEFVPELPFPINSAVANARAVVLGAQHGCLLTTTGDVECWGSNRDGQLGLGPEITFSSYAQKIPQLSNVSALTAGLKHTCAIANGTAYCWGANNVQQLGRSAEPGAPEHWIPTPVPELTLVAEIAAGANFNCVTLMGGEIYCWGANESKQLGLQVEANSASKPILQPVRNLTRIDAGRYHTCAVHQTDGTQCWGGNSNGQAGTGTPTSMPIGPTRVHELNNSPR